jgi:rsbT co-antagonist protein RsbR
MFWIRLEPKMPDRQSRIADILKSHESEVLKDWTARQRGGRVRPGLLADEQLQSQSATFLRLLTDALQRDSSNIDSPGWSDVRQMLVELSRSRADLGFTAYETAMFVFSLKQPLLERLRAEGGEGQQVADEMWRVTTLLDSLGLMTMEAYQRTRDDVIRRQQHEILELSTPVVKVWDGIVAVPLIGTLDSARTQVVMESLLDGIVSHSASIAIIDITGVPTVDTMVAQHLIKAVAAARLMGADCVISGIRPQIAQTMVQLGVELENVVTKATLADAIKLAFDRLGMKMGPA